jgi:hypothetical protein
VAQGECGLTTNTKAVVAGLVAGGVSLIVIGAFTIHVGFGLIALGALCGAIGVAVAHSD